MGHSGKTAEEFIQYSFSPLVGVLRSSQVDQIIGRNNLTFVDLLQPFCNLSSEGQTRDPSGTQCLVRNWRLVIRDVHWKPPPPVEARKILNHAVSSNNCEQTISIDIGNYKIDIPVATPWLESWREKYMEVQYVSEHEFTKHFVSCMLVGSTLDGDVADTFKNLVQLTAQLQTVTPPRLPRWFNSNVLRSYVLLHDAANGNQDKAERAFDSLKQIYGAGNCFFLCLNSRTASDPDGDHLLSDPWNKYITKRYDTSSDLNSYNNSLPRTPVDARAVSNMPVNVISDISLEHENFTFQPQETPHPLSPAEEPETGFDTANSLQNNTLSGSVGSVNSYANTSVWESVSTGTTAPVVHGASLSAHDIETIKQFVNDFAFKALLPYFERQISALQEAVATRKGVSRSLLSATKRWFGTSKPGTNSINTVVYTPDSPELQLRRLGDLWFMCGQWSRAFDAYHTAKREFSADGAWLCYAGALEMAALSAFMADEPTRKTYAYMEESITTYLNTCRMAPYAVRATILSAQCLSSRGLYGEAAKQLIRMTSEDSDLRSAVLLEQAALSFVSSAPARRTLPPMPRKYAFHMVLAANRYSKAGQKQHAYRCYKQALQVYAHSGWRLAVDHIQYALGRLAVALRRADEAVHWLAAPLAPGSPQPAPQQLALLREYTLAHQQWIESSEDQKCTLPILPLPLLLSQTIRVACGGVVPLSSPGRIPASGTSLADADSPDCTPDHKYWSKMEEMLLQEVQGTVPLVFRPTLTLYTDATDNASHPTVPQGEPLHISVQLENPLKIPLSLLDVELLWRFESGEGNPVSNETGGGAHLVSGQSLSSLSLPPHISHTLTLSLTPLQAGELHIFGVAYKLCNSIEGSDDSGNGTMITGKQLFEIRGPRLKKNKDKPILEYGLDNRLHVLVTPSAPCLQMTFSEISPWVMDGELLAVDVELQNVGPAELRNIHVAVSHPQCMRVVASNTLPDNFQQLYRLKYQNVLPNLEERVLRAMRWRASCSAHVSRVSALAPARATLLLRPSTRLARLHLLAYYEASAAAPRQFRLLRHTFNLQVMDSVKIVAIPRRNIRLKEEQPIASETLTLAVEVKNVIGGRERREEGSSGVEVLETSLLSRQWRLNESVASETALEPLATREKLHLVLRGSRSTNSKDESIINSGIKLKVTCPESAACIEERPYCEFVTDFPSPWDDEFDARGQGRSGRSGALIESTLVVRWRARVGERFAIGQHYLWLECFTDKIFIGQEGAVGGGGTEAPALRLFRREEPAPGGPHADRALHRIVIYRLEHSGAVKHNFRKRKVCLIPVQLHIVNCCASPVTAYVDWSSASDDACEVGWTGAGGLRVRLRGWGAACVRASAAVAGPGAYRLAERLRVRCGPDAALQHCAATSLLIVQQTR